MGSHANEVLHRTRRSELDRPYYNLNQLVKMVYEAKNSQSVVGRALATQRHGILGMLQNPYVFLTCLFASLGCMMYGYE